VDGGAWSGPKFGNLRVPSTSDSRSRTRSHEVPQTPRVEFKGTLHSERDFLSHDWMTADGLPLWNDFSINPRANGVGRIDEHFRTQRKKQR
jgi:hypothetical protein